MFSAAMLADEAGDVLVLPAKRSAHDRRRIREAIAERLPRLCHLLAVAEGALGGPDPEAALVYLAMLRQQIAHLLGGLG